MNAASARRRAGIPARRLRNAVSARRPDATPIRAAADRHSGAAALCLAALLFVCQLFPSCYSWLEEKVPLESAAQGTLSGLLAPPEKLEKLGTPADISASQGLYADTVVVRWSAVDYAASYCLERAAVTRNANGGYAAPDEADFEPLKDFVYGTQYSDTILSQAGNADAEYGNVYFYRVCAENVSSDCESGDFTSAECAGWLLPAPLSVEAGKGESKYKIDVTWEKVAYATAAYYLVYRSTDESGQNAIQVGKVMGSRTAFSDTTVADEQGTEFYYTVAAATSAGGLSAKSSAAMGYALQDGAPGCPTDVIVEDGLGKSKDSLTVKWTAATAADGSGTLTYSVYRTSESDSAYRRIASGLTETSYTDSGAATGEVYYYYVQALLTPADGGSTLKSAFSKSGPAAENPALGFLLSPPDYVEIADGSSDGRVKVCWTAAPGAAYTDFTYTIYCAASQDGAYSVAAECVNPEPDSGTGYLTYETDRQNFFKVATNNGGTKSEMSAAAAPSPPAPENVTATKTAYLSDIGESWTPNDGGVYPVRITWNAVSGAAGGYYVYRSARPDSGFRRITQTAVTETSLTDAYDKAKAGTPYYYKVVSLNSLGKGTKGNNPADDTGKPLAEISCAGYGALTAEQWFRQYNKTVKNSHTKLTLMHKQVNLEKLGSESAAGTIAGTLDYSAKLAGLGAEITMFYDGYTDFYTADTKALGVYFCVTGNTNSSVKMDTNGKMNGTMKAEGMYPGTVEYGNIKILSGAAGGGYYDVTSTTDLEGNAIPHDGEKGDYDESTGSHVSWSVGDES